MGELFRNIFVVVVDEGMRELIELLNGVGRESLIGVFRVGGRFEG